MERFCVLDGYLKQLDRSLDCPRANRLKFLAETQRMAEDFCQGNPYATQEEVESYLGTPKSLARTFLSSLDSEIITQYRAHLRRIRIFLLALTAAVILLLSTITVFLASRPMELEFSETLIIHETGDQT